MQIKREGIKLRNSKLKEKKLIIFDFDGVIVESTPRTGELIKEVGLFIVGLRYLGLLKKITDPAVRMIMSRKINNLKLIPETIDIVKSSSLKKTICSLNSHPVITTILEKHNLEDKFDMVVAIEDVRCPKPFPEGLNKIIDETGIAKEDTIFIGDTRTDRIASFFAGIEYLNINSL